MLAGLHQISEFNTRPHILLSNASSTASRPPSHGSGPGWFAIPCLYAFFHHCSTPVYPDAIPPGRTMARTGLRMMPTSPWSPLKFRTVGFPQYGFKAGMSDGPSCQPRVRRGLQFAIRPSCTPLPVTPSPRSKSRSAVRWCTTVQAAYGRFTPGVLAPVRVIVSRSITAYPTPSAPLAGTSRFRRRAAYTRCLRCAPAAGA